MLATLCSLNMIWEDKARNLEKLESLFSSFDFKPDVVILPEMFTTGFTMNTSLAEPMDGETVAWMKRQAAKMDCAIIGSIPVIEDGKIFNRALFVKPSGIVEYYDKRHLFRMGEENLHYTVGFEKCIVEYKGVRFALNICYDIRFPVWSRNIDNEYDVLVNVANFPSSRIKVIEPLVRARAIENLCYTLFVNRTGSDKGCTYTASSMAVDFKGNSIGDILEIKGNSTEDISEQISYSPQIIKVELDMSALQQFREKFPAWKDADHFTI